MNEYIREKFNLLDCEAPDNIVAAILEDLTSRAGLEDAWDGIDLDIQKEIIEGWLAIVKHQGGFN